MGGRLRQPGKELERSCVSSLININIYLLISFKMAQKSKMPHANAVMLKYLNRPTQLVNQLTRPHKAGQKSTLQQLETRIQRRNRSVPVGTRGRHRQGQACLGSSTEWALPPNLLKGQPKTGFQQRAELLHRYVGRGRGRVSPQTKGHLSGACWPLEGRRKRGR